MILTIGFNYCVILGLVNYEIKGVKKKYEDSFYNSGKYINKPLKNNYKQIQL